MEQHGDGVMFQWVLAHLGDGEDTKAQERRRAAITIQRHMRGMYMRWYDNRFQIKHERWPEWRSRAEDGSGVTNKN